ncbi:hypothetical protein [Streptomyces sp. PU_AKi4]
MLAPLIRQGTGDYVLVLVLAVLVQGAGLGHGTLSGLFTITELLQ